MPTHSSEAHHQRQMAESFGTDAERYDRARPRYPTDMIARIVAAAPGPAVLDVGCGTGIVARQLQAAGATVHGVEPDERMAGLARGFGLDVDVATFEGWDPAGREFDAVIAGQAWHWIDPVAGAAKAARVLRPGGLLSAFWNALELPREMSSALIEACQRVIPDSPVDLTQVFTKSAVDIYAAGLDKVADGMHQAEAFDTPDRWRYDWEHTYTREEWLDQLPTFGILTRLPAEKLAELVDALRPSLDQMGDSFTLPYSTLAITATRR